MRENQISDQAEQRRKKEIVRTSVIGIITNVTLSAFKAVIGLLSHSIAIVLDAVNNLSDAASSLITVIGARLAARKPDKQHPFGHGRIEYLSALIISIIVLYAGIASLVESIRSILHPETPDYSPVSLVIVAVAVLVKLLLGRYVKKAGIRLRSDALVNSGQDALMDAIISASTLAAAGIFLVFGLSLESWLGAAISLYIIKTGVGMLRDTISRLLGERNDPELARAIKQTVTGFPGVQGAYDLVMHNYGPTAWTGSIHIEVPDTFSAAQLDELIRDIQARVYQEHHVALTAIGVYSVNTKDAEAIEMREKVREIVFAHPYVLQMHGFYLLREKNLIRFDIVVSFDAGDRWSVYRDVVSDVQKAYPAYRLEVAMDTDYTED